MRSFTPLVVPEICDPYRNQHGRRRQNPIAWVPLCPQALPTLLARFKQAKIEGCESYRGVYADLAIAEHRLRLYALIGSTLDEALGDQPESALKNLLLALSPMGNSYLPIGSEITIAEGNLLHSGQNMRWANDSAYLYTQVFGDWKRQFTPEVRLPKRLPVKLPPLEKLSRDGEWNLFAMSES